MSSFKFGPEYRPHTLAGQARPEGRPQRPLERPQRPLGGEAGGARKMKDASAKINVCTKMFDFG